MLKRLQNLPCSLHLTGGASSPARRFGLMVPNLHWLAELNLMF
jgi:hypothetical protein